MKNKSHKLKTRLAAIFMSLAMAVTLTPAAFMMQTCDASAATTISAPKKAPGSVSWDCVYFGSYPQVEVIDKASNSGTYGQGYATSEDYVADSSLYAQLQSASYDSNGDTTINGVKYKRISQSDITTERIESKFNTYFTPENCPDYRYFRYDKIKWRVLETSDGYAMLMADKAIDCQKYYTLNRNDDFLSLAMTWEKSAIRSWLNSQFISSAFSSSEQSAIRLTTIANANNINKGIAGGNSTKDKVFLLSESDVWNTDKAAAHGFVKSEYDYAKQRRAESTSFAKAMGTWTSSTGDEYLGNCHWWLRSPGYFGYNTAFVYIYGYVNTAGTSVNSDFYGVRPALYVNLSSGLCEYAGTVVEEVETVPENISSLSLSSTTYTYSGKSFVPNTTVKSSSGAVLTKGTDYTVTYSNNKNAGTAKVTVKGIGKYTGTLTKSFTIKPASISGKTMSLSATAFVYDKNLKKPAVSVKGLSAGTDFKVTYSNNRYVGKANAKATGTGNYTGTLTKTFKINPKRTSISGLTPYSKAFTVKWAKQAVQTTGYQIRYSRYSDMTSAKTVTVTNTSTVSKKIGSLLAKKKYYVQVRTYKTVNSVKYYSSWSTKKYVTTK